MSRPKNTKTYAMFLGAATTGLLASTANFKSLKSEDLAEIAAIASTQADLLVEHYARWLGDGLPLKFPVSRRSEIPGDVGG